MRTATLLPELPRITTRNAACKARGHGKRYVAGNGAVRCWGCHEAVAV